MKLHKKVVAMCNRKKILNSINVKYMYLLTRTYILCVIKYDC